MDADAGVVEHHMHGAGPARDLGEGGVDGRFVGDVGGDPIAPAAGGRDALQRLLSGSLRQRMATSAPAFASPTAAVFPIPLLAPVTTATLPFSPNSSSTYMAVPPF